MYKFSNNKKISSFKIIRQKTGELNILTNINNKEIQLLYSLNSKNKVHTFNEINLIKKKNYLRIMIEKVISNKVNFDINKKLSLFANSAINIKR